jgi:hypothetical protein
MPSQISEVQICYNIQVQSWWERILVRGIFTMVIIDSMVLVEVLKKILSNDPNWYTKSAKKKFLKLTKKRRHGPSARYSETVRIDRKISQRLWMSRQQFRAVRCWSMDCPSVDHGLFGRVARTVRMRCVHVRSPRLGHKKSSISLFQVWINLDGYFQEIDFSKWTEWIYFVKVLNQVHIKFDSIWRSIAQV